MTKPEQSLAHLPLFHRSKQPPPLAERCLVCGTDLGASRLSIVLTAGALWKVNSSTAVPDDRMLGFLSLSYHRVLSLKGENNDVFVGLTVVEDAIGGQFDLGFCSILCVRLFFGQLLDRFEQAIDKQERNALRSQEEFKKHSCLRTSAVRKVKKLGRRRKAVVAGGKSA